MPGPASHLTIMERQTSRLIATTPPQHPVTRALTAAPQHAALGSIGPDMVFWADWGEYTPVVSTIFDIYKTLDEIYDDIMAIWGPIQRAVDKVESSLTGGLSDSIIANRRTGQSQYQYCNPGVRHQPVRRVRAA